VAAALAWDGCYAQETSRKVVRIGFVEQGTAKSGESYGAKFREKMEKLGYVDGRNLIMEARCADGHIDRLPALLNDVIKHNVDGIVTQGTPGAVAALNATKTIPIVVYAVGDPVRIGW